MSHRPFLLAFALCLTAASGHAQQQPIPGQTQTPGNHNLDEPADEGAKAAIEARRQKFIAEDRKKHMAADADRLVKLANEIKDEVDKTTKDELSVTVIKKTAEMEKLAHDIRTRMTNN